MITAIIPVRKGSQRVKNKNFKPFADSNLLEIKLNTLKQIKTIIEESRKQGTNLDIDRTLDSSSYILSNAKKSRAVIVGRVVVSGNSIVVAYVIDINKWNWALTEGFNKDQIIDNLSSEVFEEIDMDDISSYLL